MQLLDPMYLGFVSLLGALVLIALVLWFARRSRARKVERPAGDPATATAERVRVEAPPIAPSPVAVPMPGPRPASEPKPTAAPPSATIAASPAAPLPPLAVPMPHVQVAAPPASSPAPSATQTGKRTEAWRSDTAERFDVDVSVFAPRTVPVNEDFVIQAIVHRIGPEREQAALQLAAELSPNAVRLAQSPLLTQLTEGDRIELRLTAPGLEIDAPAQQMVWRGGDQTVPFIVRTSKPGALLARLQIFAESVPIGYAIIRIVVQPATGTGETRSPQVPVNGADDAPGEGRVALTRYKRAFLSYSSPDRLQVLRHHQLLNLLGVKVFQDMVSLVPGATWNTALIEEIEKADLILVYWSSAAARSEWVRKEVEYALAMREKRGNQVPDIVPVILEGPPVPPPPPTIGDRLHFNDPMRYIIYAHERNGA